MAVDDGRKVIGILFRRLASIGYRQQAAANCYAMITIGSVWQLCRARAAHGDMRELL